MGGHHEDDRDDRYAKARKAWDTHVRPGLIKAVEEVGQDAFVMNAIATAELWTEAGLSPDVWPRLQDVFSLNYDDTMLQHWFRRKLVP